MLEGGRGPGPAVPGVLNRSLEVDDLMQEG